MLVQTIREEGMDFNHMNMDRLSGQQGLLWVNQSYHAMHHIHPNSFFSSFANVLRPACSGRRRRSAGGGS